MADGKLCELVGDNGGDKEMKLSALILSWNEFDTVRVSAERMVKDGLEVWLVDNGSTDGTQEWAERQNKINTILFPTNMGISVARNAAIKEFTGDYLLMQDGDIEYMPGSAKGLADTFQILPKDAYCLGICCFHCSDNRGIVHDSWPGHGKIRNDVAIAWTQYGLFRGDLIREHHFPEQGAFHGPGWGYEDDFLNAEMEELGYFPYYCTRPVYYHEKHTGMTNLQKEKLSFRFAERMKELTTRFPKYHKWEARLREKYGVHDVMPLIREDIQRENCILRTA